MLQRRVTLNIYVKYTEILKMGCAQQLDRSNGDK